MKRFFAWLLGVLLGLVFLLAATGFWLAATDSGSQRLLRVAVYFLDGALTVGATSGRIGESFCAETISYTSAAVEVSARNLCVGVDLARLAFDDELLLQVASAGQLAITTRTAPAAESGPIEFVLPVKVVVPHLALEDLVINSTQVTGLELAGSARGGSAAIESARGTLRGYLITLNGSYGWRRGGTADLAVTARGADLDIDLTTRGSLRDLAWRLVGRQPVAAVASGRVNLLDDTLPYELALTGERMALRQWIGRPLAVSGELTASGDLAGYRFGFRGQLDDDEYGELTLALAGDGDWSSVHGDLDARRDGGSAVGTARVQWRPEFSFDATLNLTDIDLANAYTELQVSGDLGVAGNGAQVTGSVAGLRGVVNDVAFTGAGRFRWEPDDLQVDELRLQVGAGELSGHVGVRAGLLDTDLVAKSLGLSDLDARLGGILDGQVGIRGQWPDLVVQGRLAIAEPRFDDYAAQTLQVVMDAAGARPLQVQAAGVVVAERLLGDLQIDASGLLQTGSAELAWQRDDARLRGRIDYRWRDSQLDGEVAIDELEFPAVGLWRGRSGAAFSYHSGAFVVERLCLNRQDGAQLCGAVAYPDGQTLLQLQGIELHEVALLDDRFSLSVGVAADAAFTRLAPELEGALQFQLTGLEVSLDPDVDPYQLGTLQGSADISSAGAQGRVVSDAAAAVTLDLNFATVGLQADAPLSGQGRVALQDLKLLDPFLPDEVGELRGAFAGQFELLGQLGAPRWSGNLTWNDGQVRIVPTGTLLSDVSASVSAGEQLAGEAHLGAGKGKVVITAGAEEVGLGAVRRFRASVAMERAKLVDLPDYEVWVSGDVAAMRRDGIIEFKGNVNVPEASIKVNQLPEEAVSVSPDVVLADDDAPPPDLLGLRMDMTVSFGDAVRVQAYGLDTGVVGQLQVTESPGRLRQVNGVLDLKGGTFAAYGQELVIQRGRLIFNGPIDNPTLDVVARRKVESEGQSYDVLLTLTGPARQIVTRVSTQPATTEADALSLLITGRRLTDSSRTERVNLAAAAQVLGIKSASLLSDRIGGLFGVDEVIVEGDEENLEVGAGMQINPNLYVRYTYDVFSRLGGMLLNYKLTRNLSLHGRSGDAQSIHLNYEVDL